MNYLSYMSDAEVVYFLFDSGDLTILTFDNCSGFVLFEFFNSYSRYDSTFFSQIVCKPILTAQGIYSSHYSIASETLDHKATDKSVCCVDSSDVEYSDVAEVSCPEYWESDSN